MQKKIALCTISKNNSDFCLFDIDLISNYNLFHLKKNRFFFKFKFQNFKALEKATNASRISTFLNIIVESLVLKVGEEKEIGKNGLKKKLVKESEGWEAPDTSDEVEGES